jgi:hypothetical protein
MLPNLSNHQFEALIQGARILEKDGFGLKVLRLPDAFLNGLLAQAK